MRAFATDGGLNSTQSKLRDSWGGGADVAAKAEVRKDVRAKGAKGGRAAALAEERIHRGQATKVPRTSGISPFFEDDMPDARGEGLELEALRASDGCAFSGAFPGPEAVALGKWMEQHATEYSCPRSLSLPSHSGSDPLYLVKRSRASFEGPVKKTSLITTSIQRLASAELRSPQASGPPAQEVIAVSACSVEISTPPTLPVQSYRVKEASYVGPTPKALGNPGAVAALAAVSEPTCMSSKTTDDLQPRKSSQASTWRASAPRSGKIKSWRDPRCRRLHESLPWTWSSARPGTECVGERWAPGHISSAHSASIPLRRRPPGPLRHFLSDLSTQPCYSGLSSNTLTDENDEGSGLSDPDDGFTLLTQRASMEACFSDPRPEALLRQYLAGVATEYRVTATESGSRQQTKCLLILDGEYIYHRAFPEPQMPHHFLRWRCLSSFLARMLRRMFSLPAESTYEFTARRNLEAHVIRRDSDNPRRLFVHFGPCDMDVNYTYDAETRAECDEIIARLHFLQQIDLEQSGLAG
mmetsp:Transcript_71480/g.155266  ORF Transcript_71480/g.155266 Transcript_71480/m.155266 type:complete len:526 (+) Transcript_71480:59-1636(+)